MDFLCFCVFFVFVVIKPIQNTYMKKCLHLFETHIWFAHIPAVHRNIHCWLEKVWLNLQSACTNGFLPSTFWSLPGFSFPAAEWSTLRKKRPSAFCWCSELIIFAKESWFQSSFLGLMLQLVWWLCQANWQRLLGFAKSCWSVTRQLTTPHICLFDAWISAWQRNNTYSTDSDKNVMLCDVLAVKSKWLFPDCHQWGSSALSKTREQSVKIGEFSEHLC